MAPAVPVFLSAATKCIVPISSKNDHSKHIAMQFLNADRDRQTQMLRDPNVARAILCTLGESAPRSQGVATMPAAMQVGQMANLSPGTPRPNAVGGGVGARSASNAPPLGAPVSSASVATIARDQYGVGPVQAVPCAGGSTTSKPAWSGRMALARSMGKQLNMHAALLYGRVQLVELCLRIAAGNSGVLNISHRVPFDDLARRTPGAVFSFVPCSQQEHSQYDEYVHYFKSKARAGVAHLDEVDALYIVPPSDEAAPLLNTLQAAGASAFPKNTLLGVVAPRPGPPTAVNTASVPGTPARPVQPSSTAPAVQGGRNDVDMPRFQTGSAVATAIEMKSESVTKTTPINQADSVGDTNCADGGDLGQEISNEALLDLFSNPELIRSLQSADDAAAVGASD